MRRSPVRFLTIVIALATGAVLGQAIAAVTTPTAVVIAPTAVVTTPTAGFGPTTAQTVRAFYDAANAAILTGDVAALDPVVAPTFVDHAAPPGAPPERARLGRSLATIHAVAPSAHLVIKELVVAGDRAVVRVAIEGMEQGTFVGIALSDDISVWGSIDVLRVADRRVAERWGGTEDLLELLPLGRVATGTNLAAGIGLTLERVTFRPGDRAVGSAGETRVLEVQGGTVTVAVDAASATRPLLVRVGTTDGDAPSDVREGSRVILYPGDLVVLPATATYVLTNDGVAPATALVAAAFPAVHPRRGGVLIDPDSQPIVGMVATVLADTGSPWPADLAVQTLIGVTPFPTLPGTPTIGVGRLVLAPGASLPIRAAPGPLLLVVETGALVPWSSDGARWNAAGALAAGDGALVPPEAILSLHNPGLVPAAVLVVAVEWSNLSVKDAF